MCWTSTDNNITANHRIAKENVPIYKMLIDLHGELLAFYRNTPYVLNKLYEVTMETPSRMSFSDSYTINVGLHCYSSKYRFRQCVWGISAFSPGFTRHMMYDSTHTVLAEGYIPSGTEYYINDSDEIVTSKLVLTKILKLCVGDLVNPQ